MTERMKQIDEMSCDELLAELSMLTASRDRHDAATSFPVEQDTQQGSHVDAMLATKARIDRITELLKQRGCA